MSREVEHDRAGHGDRRILAVVVRALEGDGESLLEILDGLIGSSSSSNCCSRRPSV
jgi:hypothetical protein